MNNQITLAYLDYDDLDALQVVSVVSFYESFIDGADPLDMQGYLQTQLTTEILAVELAQSTSKFIGIKDHQILIGYMKVNDGVLPTKSGKHTLSKIRHKECRFFLR